jgi:membrane-associated phospholipid phosphatase
MTSGTRDRGAQDDGQQDEGPGDDRRQDDGPGDDRLHGDKPHDGPDGATRGGPQAGDPFPRVVVRRAVVVGVVCAVLLVVVYLVAVWTRAGQRFEDAVLRGADLAARGGRHGAAATLDRISVATLDKISELSLGAAVAGVLAIGLLRRRPALALAGAGVIVGSVLTAVILRNVVLLRPVLLHAGERREDQSFPSGHTTIAMAVMCGLVMVVPYRLRGGVVLLISLWAAGVGAATVTASWHRPSDTIGGDLIVLIYACAAIALLARNGSASRRASRARVGRMTLVALGTGAVVAAAVLNDVTAALGPVGAAFDSALAAGRAIALAGGALVAVAILALLRGIDLTPSPPGPL